MHVRRTLAATTAALALVFAGGGMALADKISGDADNDALSPSHPGSQTVSQAIGTTATYPFSAIIENSGNTANDVFPSSGGGDALPALIQRSGTWLADSPGTPSSFSFTDYLQLKGGEIAITVPCSAEVGQQSTMSVTITAGTNNTGKALNPDSVTLEYRITASAPVGSSCDTTTDTPPSVTVDDASGDEGAPIALTARVDDDGLSPVTYAWSYEPVTGVDDGATCTFSDDGALATTLECTDDGVFKVTLEATDGAGSDSAPGQVTVSNVDPTIKSASFEESYLACGPDNASLAFESKDAGSNDTHVAAVDWDNDGIVDETVDPAASPISHTYRAGAHTANLTITDDDGGSATTSATAVVDYTMSGILQPINTTGLRSVFKYGNTIPVKVKIFDCDGTPAVGLTPVISVKKISSADPEGVEESPGSTSGADTGRFLRYTGDGGQYIYNLATSTLSVDKTATYEVTVTIPSTSQTAKATFGLK